MADDSARLEMLEALECESCGKPLYSPIYQCHDGHAFCSICKEESGGRRCPACQAEIPKDIRSLRLEKLASCIDLPCRYYSEGCREMSRHSSKEQHEQGCKFKPYNCPSPNCEYTGNVPSLLEHLDDLHECVFHRSPSFVDVKWLPCTVDGSDDARSESSNSGGEASLVSVINCNGEHFCLIALAAPFLHDLFYLVIVALIGEPWKAKGFRYKLKIGDHTRHLVWVGVPWSTEEIKNKDAENGLDALVIHNKFARFFDISDDPEGWRGKGFSLRITGRIWSKSAHHVPPAAS